MKGFRRRNLLKVAEWEGLESSQIQKNEVTTQGYGLYAIANRPLRAADQDYPRGLHFLSEGEVVVHLPEPADVFEAIVGVDSNRVTAFLFKCRSWKCDCYS